MTPPKRTFVPEDLYRLVQVGDPQMHPDGDVVAFVRAYAEGEKKEMRSHIWIATTAEEGGPARPYTRGPRRDAQPRWSPDGRRLAFVRQTGDGPDGDRQIWLLSRDGGEAWPLTSMRHGVGDLRWSPDGRRIAFTAAVGDDETDDEAMTPYTEAERKEEKQRRQDEGRLVRRFQYKFDHRGLLPPRRTHVWVVEVPEGPPPPEQDLSAAGEGDDDGRSSARAETPRPRRVTQRPFDHSLLDWSPDGTRLAVGASYEDERLPVQDVWIFAVPDGDGPPPAPTRLTGGDGLFYDARWSPDGRRLAVVGHLREHRTATLQRLWLFPAPGAAGRPVNATAHWDRGLGAAINSDFRPGMAGSGLTWAPDGDAVFFVAEDAGRAQLYRLALPQGAAAEGDSRPATPDVVVGGPREIYGFSFNRAGDRVALAAADMFNPGDVYAARVPAAESDSDSEREDGWPTVRLTAVNGELLSRIAWPTVEEITFPSEDGLPIHGWIMRPVSRDDVGGAEDEGSSPPARSKAPFVLQIHGGPHTAWGHSFSLEMHLQAAMGYGVLFVNPRGSSGYGQRFAQGVLDDYGGRDYEDLMAAVDYAIGLGGVDARRLAVTGGSYGGFMTNWIVTQTNRFRAGVSHRSISNWISFWGVSDIGPRFLDGEFGAPSLWDGFEDMWERSPLKHARRVETPLLLCHSEHDLRCPMEQAEQFYVALKWEGKVVQLLRHPRSNHDLTRTGPPTLRVDRFHHIARFLKEHLGDAEGGR